jgi:exportin-2 (importin alpha re-exporter)
MYVELYPEMLARSRSVAIFVRALWELVGGGKQLGLAYDQASILFPSKFTSSSRTSSSCPNLCALSPPRFAPAHIAISSSHETIRRLIAGVVVPNLALRPHDAEAFEDTPLEYVRAELQVSEVASLRQAAADVVKTLCGVGPDCESATTGVALEWIRRVLAEADAAVYLFEAVAMCSGTLAVPLSPVMRECS